MSFFEDQMGIVKQCAYETTAIVAPGVIISSTIGSAKNQDNFIQNSLLTARVSAAYFVSCITKYEVSSLKSEDPTILEDLAFNTGSGVIGGLAYYGTSYHLNTEPSFSKGDLVASVFMSTGYSIAFSYIPRPYLTAAIFFIELGTSVIPGLITPTKEPSENFVDFYIDLVISDPEIEGSISGTVFSAIGLIEHYLTHDAYITSNSTENYDICPTYETKLLGLHTEL